MWFQSHVRLSEQIYRASACTPKLNLFGETIIMPKRGLLLEMLDKYALVSISVLMVGLICSSSATRDASIVEMSPKSRSVLFSHDWSATTSLHRDCWRCRVVAGGERGEQLHVIMQLVFPFLPAYASHRLPSVLSLVLSCLLSLSWSTQSTYAKVRVDVASSCWWINQYLLFQVCVFVCVLCVMNQSSSLCRGFNTNFTSVLSSA